MSTLIHHRFRRLIGSLLLVFGLQFATPAEVCAFDWEGRLQRELKGLRSKSAMTRRWAVSRLSRFPAAQVRKHVLRALQDVVPMVQVAAAEVAASLRIKEAAPVLTRWLSHWDDKLREAAARYLAPIRGRAATALLLRSLVDPEPKVRRRIILSLASLADPRAVLPIIARLEDPNIEVRVHAVDVLATFRDRRAVIPLMARLSDPSSRVRKSAVAALGQLGDPRSAPAIARLLRDPTQDVVGSAIDTLGKLRYAGAVEPLIEVFQTRDSRYREPAATALAAIGTELAMATLVKALSHPKLRAAAKGALSSATRQVPAHLNRLLFNPRTPRHVALIAVQIARDARIRGAVPHLVEQLRLGRLPRLLIVEALGRIADPRAQRPLLGLLNEKDHELKLAALAALKEILDPRAAEPLLSCLADHSAEVRRITISYLGQLRARVATPALQRIARQAAPTEAYAAMAALARIADPRSVPTLLQQLANGRARIRRLAVVAFGRLKLDEKSVQQLLRLCKRRGGATRLSCIQALGTALRGRSHPKVLRFLSNTLAGQSPAAVLATLDALAAQRDKSIVPMLVNHLPKVKSSQIRARILAVLGNHVSGANRTLPLLLSGLRAGDARVAAASAWALSKLRIPSTARELALATQSPHWSTRINAAAALASARVSSHHSLLHRLLQHRDPYVRANALLGLMWLGEKSAEDAARRFVQQDQSPWVRSNALRLLLRYRPSPLRLPSGRQFANASALAREMIRSDADPRVRRVAKRLLDSTSSASPYRWVQIYLRDRHGKALRDAPYVLVLPNGLIKADRSGPRSLLWEEDIPPGHVFLELPPDELVKPRGKANEPT